MESSHPNADEVTAPEFDTSFFPAPSPYFARYTAANLALAPDALISNVPGEPRPFRASELEPPNVDWIVEEGNYSVFGETWPIEEHLPTLDEMGLREMYDKSQDRRESLQTLLRALLVTYTQLLNSLLTPPPSLVHPPPPPPPSTTPSTASNGAHPSHGPTDPERLTEHIRLITINMHHLVNELRPVQARETLKLMMRSQIDRRREKTLAIKQRCQEVQSTLADLQARVQTTSHSVASPDSAAAQNRLAVANHSSASESIQASPASDVASIRNQLARLVKDL